MSQNEKINEGLIAGGFKIHTTFFFFSLVRSLCVLAASEHRIGFTDRQVAVKLNRTGARVRRRTPLAQRAGRLLSEQAACSAAGCAKREREVAPGRPRRLLSEVARRPGAAASRGRRQVPHSLPPQPRSCRRGAVRRGRGPPALWSPCRTLARRPKRLLLPDAPSAGPA